MTGVDALRQLKRNRAKLAAANGARAGIVAGLVLGAALLVALRAPAVVPVLLTVLGVGYGALSVHLVSARDDRGLCRDCGATRAAAFPIPPISPPWSLRPQRYESLCAQDIARRVVRSRPSAPPHGGGRS